MPDVFIDADVTRANLANALENMADTQSELGHRDDAEKIYREALAQRRRLAQGGYVSAHVDVTLRALGGLMNDAGKPGKAEDFYKEAVQALAQSRPPA